MDLIYTNSNREDTGVLLKYELDLAYGSDENNFEITVILNEHCCEAGNFLYIENTEYGGIIDIIGVDIEKAEITYSGRTWHGILNSKIIEPDTGQDYLTISGEANSVIATLIDRLQLSDLFTASSADSGIVISGYKMNRYIAGYDGIKKMLKASGAKLILTFKDGMVELSAVPLVDYSQDEQFDTDQISFAISKYYSPVNHVICLGRGELNEREVIHIYADENGNISTTQSLTGLKEVTAVYDYANAESIEELQQGGIEIINASQAADEVSFSFDSDSAQYDIGDIVGAKEFTTGIEVTAEITKKIVTIKDNLINISYKVGE